MISRNTTYLTIWTDKIKNVLKLNKKCICQTVNSPRNTRNNFLNTPTFYSCSLYCVSSRILLLSLSQSSVWRPLGFCPNKPENVKQINPVSGSSWGHIYLLWFSAPVLEEAWCPARLPRVDPALKQAHISTKSGKQARTEITEINLQYLNGFKAITLMVKVVEAIHTVAVVTKLSICKAVTIPERLKQMIFTDFSQTDECWE